MLVMTFEGKLAGFPARIAADSQASHNFVSDQWVQRAGVHVKPLANQVTLASGEAAHIIRLCTLRLQMEPLHDAIDCFVMRMASQHDVILGESYLKSRRAVLSYANNTMTLFKGDRKISVAA